MRIGLVVLLLTGFACSRTDERLQVEVEPSIEMTPCRFEAFDRMIEGMTEEEKTEREVNLEAGDALCGELDVWENRSLASGRKIGISVIVLPATDPDPEPDPLFLFAGGPGGAVSTWSWVAEFLGGIRARRDIVLVDQRGTGGSHPLACPVEGSDDDIQGYIDPMLDPEWVRTCLERLQPIADLTQYSSVNAADDIDDVRRALGYERINLDGGSYGTRPVQVYARRHPEHVRAASMAGIMTMDFQYPLHHSSAGQRALDLLLEACAGDEECKKAYPDPASDLDTLLARFADGPLAVEIDHPTRDERVEVTLHGEVLAERFRSLMYNARGSVRIPGLVRRAVESGELEELAEEVLAYQLDFNEGVNWFSGMWLSVVCGEDVYLIDDQEVEESTAGTIFGDYRVQVLRRACEQWPRSELPEGFHEDVRSEAPFLVTSGDLDPVTPPWGGHQVVEHFPNGLHVVIREGHGATDGECSLRVLTAFLESGTTEGLDVSCLREVDLPPWDLG